MTQCVKLLLTLLCGFMLAACTTNTAIREDFDKSFKAYNRMLRWQEVEQAGMRYMEPEQRDAFMTVAEQLKKRKVTITDYRILTTECLPEAGSGDVSTEFDYFILPSNRIKTLTYRQKWVYREIGGEKGWRVKSPLPAFE